MERLTTGRLESQRLLVPMVVELPPAARQALLGRAAELERLGFEVEEFGGDALSVSAVPALLGAEEAADDAARARPRTSKASTAAPGRGRAPADRRDDGVPRGGEGELPADLREDGAHPRGAARDRVLDHLPARPAGDAAAHAAGDREEFQRI